MNKNRIRKIVCYKRVNRTARQGFRKSTSVIKRYDESPQVLMKTKNKDKDYV